MSTVVLYGGGMCNKLFNNMNFAGPDVAFLSDLKGEIVKCINMQSLRNIICEIM